MNYKLLLSSTALAGAGILFASSTPASAQDFEVSLQGYTEFGVAGATENTLQDAISDRGYGFFMDNEVHVLATGTTDAGIEYGSIVELEIGSTLDSPTFSEDAFVDEVLLFFSGAFGRVELGREDGAEDVMLVAGEDVAAGTGGFDGDTANLIPFSIQDSGDATKATYFTPRVGGFQLGASYAPDFSPDDFGVDDPAEAPGSFGNTLGVGANWTGAFGGFDMTLSGVGFFAESDGVSAANPTDADITDWELAASTGIAGIEVAGAYFQRTDFGEGDGFNVGLGYGFGPVNTSLGYVYFDPDAPLIDEAGGEVDDQQLIALSGDVGILPGVVLKGDVTWNSDDENAEDGATDTWAGVLTVQLNY